MPHSASRGRTPETREHVVVDHHDAEGRVPDHDRPDRKPNFAKTKNEFSAIPVMIPGRAIGRMSRNETGSRPKNLNR